VIEALSAELEHCIQQPLEVINAYVHRWLYSCVAQGLETREGYLWDEAGLGLIGDYLGNGDYGVESAWLSGKQLADWLTLIDSAGHS
jgi:predicted NAD/FAD-dependent oxidoreductase